MKPFRCSVCGQLLFFDNSTCLSCGSLLGYLADVLTTIVNGHPNSQIDRLLPWAYIRPPELKAVA